MNTSKFTNLLGSRNVRKDKTTEAQHGKSFTEMRAQEAEWLLKRQVREQFGELIESDEERPWPGAFTIVSEEMVAAWLHLLEANGLRRFSDNISVDWFTRAEKLPKDDKGTLVMATPIGGEPLFRFPGNPKEMASLVFRIVLIDPQFMDENDQPLYKEIPPRYVEAVMNTLNPAAMYRAYKHSLPEMLKRAGDFEKPFQQLLEHMEQKWRGKDAPVDFETLTEYVGLGFIHEAVHALVMHLPDEIPADLPAAEREALEAISLDRYLDIINKDQTLLTSVVFTKNLFKALEKVEEETPSKKTQDSISVLIALEMFCDRFSMYLYENYLKIQMYDEVLKPKIGYPITADSMLVLETSRRDGRLASRSEVQGLSADELIKLDANLQAAEKDHVYISRFGDPLITSAERELFQNFLNLLKYFDDEDQIMRFSMQHADSSRFMHATASGLVQESAVGVAQYVRENLLRLPGPAALAVGIVRKLQAPREGRAVLAMDIKQTVEQVYPEAVEETAPETLPELPDIQLAADRPSTGFKTTTARGGGLARGTWKVRSYMCCLKALA